MTEKRLIQLEALCQQATPGPWRPREYQNNAGDIWIDCWAFANRGRGRALGGTVATVHAYGAGKRSVEANAAFIAEARTAIPELLAEVLRLRAAVKSMS